MGPLTLGYARWANLAPAVTDLQSFGHASVSEDGELTIKLIGIDGTLMYEKTMSPMGSTEESSTSSETETESTDSAEESTTELPITTSDVFIQSGEVSDSSVNIMSRCNNEADSSMKLWVIRSLSCRISGRANTSLSSGCPNRTNCSSLLRLDSRLDSSRISSSVSIGMACASSIRTTTCRPSP